MRKWVLVFVLIAVVTMLAVASAGAALMTEEQLRARVEAATKGFCDLTMVGNVLYKDKKALEKVDSAYARLYDFSSASVSLKTPDKIRMEGKLGMVKFEYVINGTTKIFRAPKVGINKRDDYSDDPAKLQEALDVGIVTPSIWRFRRVQVVDDPEADANHEVKLLLRWNKGDMRYYIWLDADNLWLKKFEKRDSADNLQTRIVYSNPKKAGDLIWMPTKVEMYASDGSKAGVSEFCDIKVNIGLQDSLFQ